MIKHVFKYSGWYVVWACLLCVTVETVAAQRRPRPGKNSRRPAVEKTSALTAPASEAQIVGKKIHLTDGSIIQADEVWKNGEDFWYRIGGITQRVYRSVKSIEPIRVSAEKPPENTAETSAVAVAANPPASDSLWVLLKSGARMKVDDVTESDEGAWCRRGNFSVLIASDRIERIERDSALAKPTGWKQRDWTTGQPRIDQLIRANGSRFGVDPYLVFCVIEHESHFRTRAVSPKGAQGLMQLMPGTAARFGVRNPFDPAQNINGGTQYLKELLKMFGGRVDLALASYNAGEGAVLKYGGKVPPYRETREYVRRISGRYGFDPKRGSQGR